MTIPVVFVTSPCGSVICRADMDSVPGLWEEVTVGGRRYRVVERRWTIEEPEGPFAGRVPYVTLRLAGIIDR